MLICLCDLKMVICNEKYTSCVVVTGSKVCVCVFLLRSLIVYFIFIIIRSLKKKSILFESYLYKFLFVCFLFCLEIASIVLCLKRVFLAIGRLSICTDHSNIQK